MARFCDITINISKIPNVKIGDKVIVNGYEGETEVTVKELFTADETELGIPLQRFKRVLRKA